LSCASVWYTLYSSLGLFHPFAIVQASEITSGAAGPSMDKIEKPPGLCFLLLLRQSYDIDYTYLNI